MKYLALTLSLIIALQSFYYNQVADEIDAKATKALREAMKPLNCKGRP